MCRKNGIYLFVIALGFILVLGSLAPVVDIDDDDLESTMIISEPERSGFLSSTPHVPIVIDGDVNFTATAQAEGWPGNGTSGNPFIIEGLEIDRSGAPGHGIRIGNTRVHFVVRDSNLTGVSVYPWSGIYLNNVTNGVLINNTCTSNFFGIHFFNSNSTTVANNTCTNNSHGIYLEDSHTNTLSDNICNSNSLSGIGLFISESNTVSDNTCTNNSLGGIFFFASYFNTVSENTVTSNLDGIHIEQSASNTVANNSIANNTNVGIYVEASDLNDFRLNVFVDSPTNGYDDGLGSNVFDYNYWSDYAGSDSNGDGFGDTPYTFTSNSDPHPLMYFPFAPDWLHHPVDQVIEFGNVFEYPLEFITTAQTAPYELFVDDVVNFAAVYDDTIISNSALPVGVYPLQVVATNIYGCMTEGAFTLTVEDTTAPLITSPEDITYTKGEGDHEIAWTMSDLSPISYRVLLNGTELTSSPVTATSQSFSMTLEDKDPGVYNYSMVAEDIWGNMAIDTVIVTVLPIPLLEVLLPWLSVGAVAVIVLVVIVFVLQKRKSS